MDAAIFDSGKIQECFQQVEFAAGEIIAGKVMAIARMAPGNKHAINALVKGFENIKRIDPAGARHAQNTQVWRVLQTAHPCEIGAGIGAPVA